MKYKRRKTKVSKYISHCDAQNNREILPFKKRASAAIIFVMVMFLLSGFGLVKRPVIKSIFGHTSTLLKNFSQISEKNSVFLKTAGEHILNFCYGYLKEPQSEQTKVYAVSKKENKTDTEIKTASDCAADSAAQSDAAVNTLQFLPVMPCVGEVSSPFGKRIHPVSGEEKNHNGIDIAAMQGTQIVACEDGTVETAAYNEYSGNHIVIKHHNGYVSSYSHMSELVAGKGATVKKGDIIGLVGSTGIATGPHLHFEIKLGDIPQDPQKLINSE